MGDRRGPPGVRPAPGAGRAVPGDTGAGADRDGPPESGLIVHDAQGRVRSATAGALELLGVTLNQLRAAVPRPPVWTFTDASGRPVDPRDLPPFAVAQTGRAVPGALVSIDDGSRRGRRWLRVECEELRSGPGPGELLVTVVRDVTGEQRAQATRRAAVAVAARVVAAGPGDADGLSADVLEIVGAACDAARAVRIDLDRVAGRARLSQEWSADGRGWPRRGDSSIPIDVLARLMRHLAKGRPLVVSDRRYITDAPLLRSRLDEWALRAAVLAPMMLDGRLAGFVGVTWERPLDPPPEVKDLVVTAADALAGVAGTARLRGEITELRARMAAQLTAQVRRNELYVDVTPDLLLTIDRDNRLIALDMPAPFESDELSSLVGHDVLTVFEGDDRERLDEVLRAVRAGSPIEIFEFEWPDGPIRRRYHARFTAGEGDLIVTVIRDVTGTGGGGDRAEVPRHDSLAIANEELTRLVHERDRFLASVSHELRTPLNAILGLTEMLLDGREGPTTASQDTMLRTIESSGRHLLELINDLLDLSRLRARVVALDLRNVLVNEPCELALELVRPRALARGVHVELSRPDGAVRVRADERRLRQVLINLLDNAVNYTEPGGTAGLEISRPDPDHVALAVWDTGSGISAGDQDRIFEPFTQLRGRRGAGRTGSGLGLSVVERLVALHDGRIEVDSSPGRGSRFTVVLPVAGPAGEGGPPTGPPASESAPGAAPGDGRGPAVDGAHAVEAEV